jgi:hypothetical protein
MTDNIIAQEIASEVLAELARQDAKWGEQNHPDGTGPLTLPLFDAGAFLDDDTKAVDLADAFTRRTNERADQGEVTWRDILLEEVFEALAEDDLVKLRTELIQVSAVAEQWVAAIDRRRLEEVYADRASRR